MREPPGATATQNGITGTRPKAETKRVLSARVVRRMKAAGLEPHGWQVRQLVTTLLERDEVDVDALEHGDDVVDAALLAAPWYPKPRIRRFRVGDPGPHTQWRTHT